MSFCTHLIGKKCVWGSAVRYEKDPTGFLFVRDHEWNNGAFVNGGNEPTNRPGDWFTFGWGSLLKVASPQLFRN